MATKARPRRWRPHVRSIVVGLELPGLALLVLFAGAWGALALLPAAVLTASFLRSFDSPWSISPRSRAHLYLGLWPFFALWVALVALVPLTLLVVPIGLLGGLPAAHAFAVAATLAGGVGLASVRRTPRVTRVTVSFPDLPPELDGYTIAQLSDIHCGPFAPEARVADWARRTRRLRADLIAVTGDLIAHGREHVRPVARALGELRAPDGVFVCMGNHDYWGGGEALVGALEEHGLRVLRNTAQTIRRGAATLVCAGVDDTWSGRAQVRQALAGSARGGFPILLAHDPDLFDEAARHGARLVLSGHTHGGQLGVPFAARRWNLARLAHRYAMGLYRRGDACLYVNSGAGTTGPPIRVGVRAEIALIVLRKRV